jgi:hypothetical protein
VPRTPAKTGSAIRARDVRGRAALTSGRVGGTSSPAGSATHPGSLAGDAPSAASPAATSPALANRRAGSFSSSRITSWSIPGDTSACWLGGSTAPNICSAMISPAPSATNGGRPTSM